MRIGLFGQSGPYAGAALRHLLTAQDVFKIALVVEGKTQPLHGRENRLFEPQPRPVPDSKSNDLSTVATASGVAALLTSNANSAEAVGILQDHNLDWIVVAGFDYL